MNTLRKQLKEQTIEEERAKKELVASDPNRLKFHLMPQVGWINDPNGLCQFHGVYHVFYQYSPLDVEGGMKAWGHKTSKDMLYWKQEPTEFFPDMPFDKDGVYSGSACIAQNKMYLFYTGNVKQEGEHDFTNSGREANTILVTSSDGIHFSEKELLMTNHDYPSDYTCHIRDPKVWQEGNTYYMVQGGRKRGEVVQTPDYGAILLFASENLHHWELIKELTAKENFGYMWECPDYFELDGKPVLSFSPQGLEAGEYRYQNVYQSGYLFLEKRIIDDESENTVAEGDLEKGKVTEWIKTEAFTEWDMGFDFYAPQTFLDEKGRRIIIGWAGIGDADYDNEPTVKMGWQHALTMPRELTLQHGKIYQRPVAELLTLRKKEVLIAEGETYSLNETYFELIAKKEKTTSQMKKEVQDAGISNNGAETDVDNQMQIILASGQEQVVISYQSGVLTLSLTKEAGRGRTARKMRLEKLDEIHLYADTSLLELYVNDGEAVFTTRYYFGEAARTVCITGMTDNTLFYLSEMEGN